ncbi:hydroxypyruvate isomerase family protein [Roseobacter sp. HKCCA0434]|uniref:hydroxypyruvate isomerase family protein n=1 Tax=Roseobacter sp. HKCCA0434 TaxID=3079297 RepID=UPI002905B4E8|nr:TIM barrel protein [Roseobacter sp. HKCCA0434]
MRVSASLPMLFPDLAPPAAVHAAKAAGFDAVELHWPYQTDAGEVADALDATGLPLLSINTARGDDGDFGLSALPDRGAEARRAIDAAIGYARRTRARFVHVMAGKAEGSQAEATFRDALLYACEGAQAHGLTTLIEPINGHDVPGYFLQDIDHAARIVDELACDGLRLMFDCYHVARMGGDVMSALKAHLPRIAHIQIAGVPDRAEPDHGTLDYRPILDWLDAQGWEGYVGAEYRPGMPGDFDWMTRLR